MSHVIVEQIVVRWSDRIVGELSLDRNGAMHFAYGADWLDDADAVPISVSLPKQTEVFADRECKPFFDGLLPEEWQRVAAARAVGVSSGNPFRLLAALGGDVAGALTFTPLRIEPLPQGAVEYNKPLNDSELAGVIDRFAKAPMLAGEGVSRYSLAGAQSKLPVVLVDGQIALAAPGQATTHIIKPEPVRFPGLAANEAFCLTLARGVGLKTAAADWRSVAGRPFLLVERYDRVIESPATLRLHQEDFAQALGVVSARKYASDGGPVFRDCFALIRRAATDPENELLKLVDAALFNLIIGNADAHAKNFSLLCKPDGDVVLAPLYDLVATGMWPELSPRMAMKYGRAKTLEEMSRGSFERFAEDAGVTFEVVRKRGTALCERVIQSIDKVGVVLGSCDGGTSPDVVDMVADRAKRISLKLNF